MTKTDRTNAARQAAWRERQKQKLAQAEQAQAKPYYEDPATPEQMAVNVYGKGSDSLRKLDLAMHALASHIRQMAIGTRDDPYPLWRKLQYRDATIQPESFERYLLDKPRKGLGIPSLAWLYDRLKNDQKTLEVLRREIPDFDQKAVTVAKIRTSKPDQDELERLREALRASTSELAKLEDERDSLKLELARLKQDIEPGQSKRPGRKKKPAT